MRRNSPSRKNSTQTIKDVLGEIMSESKIRKGMMEHRAVAYWEQVMGKSVARLTTNLYFKYGTLYVSLNSSVVRGELIMMKDKIIIRMNEAIGANTIRNIVFK
jgi:predicted nucleic acid-binding Zn ribbon protein